MKRVFFLFLILFVLFSGCTEEKKPLVLIHQTWIGDGPIYLAQEKGFLEENGVKIDILRVENEAERRILISNGKADISLETIDMSVVDIGSGADEVIVMLLNESVGADGIISSKEIKSIKDLEGKTIGCGIGNPPYFLLRILMKENGMDKDSINFIDIPAEQAGVAFVKEEIDAACTWEPWLSKANERKGGHLLISSADVPGTIVDVMVVRSEVLENRKEEVKAVIKSWFQAQEYIKENPKESYEIMGKTFGLNEKEFEELIQGIKWNSLEENKLFFDSNIFELTHKINEIAFEDEMISSLINVDKAIDSNLIKEID